MISSGYNQKKSHPRQYRANKAAKRVAIHSHLHAEIDALIKSRKHDLTGSEAFIYRLDGNGNLGMCRPCEACMASLKHAGVSSIVYTTKSGVRTEEI